MTVVVGVLVLIFGAWSTVGYVSTKGIETPAYEVLTEANGYEIREYRPQIDPTLAEAIHACIEPKVERRCPSIEEFLQMISTAEDVDVQ